MPREETAWRGTGGGLASHFLAGPLCSLPRLVGELADRVGADDLLRVGYHRTGLPIAEALGAEPLELGVLGGDGLGDLALALPSEARAGTRLSPRDRIAFPRPLEVHAIDRVDGVDRVEHGGLGVP